MEIQGEKGAQQALVQIVAVNLADRQCMTERGDLIPLTTFFDSDGEECDPDAAVATVGGS
jgi:hypothetical protein